MEREIEVGFSPGGRAPCAAVGRGGLAEAFQDRLHFDLFEFVAEVAELVLVEFHAAVEVGGVGGKLGDEGRR